MLCRSERDLLDKILLGSAYISALILIARDLANDLISKEPNVHELTCCEDEKKYYIADEFGNLLTKEAMCFDQANRFVINYNAINAHEGRKVQIAVMPSTILYNDEDEDEGGNSDEESESR